MCTFFTKCEALISYIYVILARLPYLTVSMDSSFPVLTAGIVVPLCAGAAWVFYRYRNQPGCKWTIDEKTQQALRRYVLIESTHGKPDSVLQTFREYAIKNSMIKKMLFTPDQGMCGMHIDRRVVKTCLVY